MKWHGQFFVDLVDMVEWILCHNYSIPDLLHYLDDYITAGPPECLNCTCNFVAAASSVSKQPGLPLHPDKIVGPSTCLTALGIELNSILQIA